MSVRLALLGAGRIGQVHAEALSRLAGAELRAVADADAQAAARICTASGAEQRTIDAIVSAGDIDAVLICTPTDTHANLIERLARAGKAIFCEKPIDLDVARVRACLRVVHETGARLMVGFNRRFDPDFMALKAQLDAGAVGSIEMITLTSRDPAPPPADYIRRSGGIFRDMTIHDFDMARWLLGEEVSHVQAAASVLVDDEIATLGDFDSAHVILECPSGRQAVISNSRRAAYGYDQRIEVLGAAGMIRARNSHQSNIEVASAKGFQSPPLLDFFMTRYRAAYANEMAAFVAAIGAGAPMPCDGQDGLAALGLAEAALRSVREGRRIAVAEVLAQ